MRIFLVASNISWLIIMNIELSDEPRIVLLHWCTDSLNNEIIHSQGGS